MCINLLGVLKNIADEKYSIDISPPANSDLAEQLKI